jgi:hypothetical protein
VRAYGDPASRSPGIPVPLRPGPAPGAVLGTVNMNSPPRSPPSQHRTTGHEELVTCALPESLRQHTAISLLKTRTRPGWFPGRFPTRAPGAFSREDLAPLGALHQRVGGCPYLFRQAVGARLVVVDLAAWGTG